MEETSIGGRRRSMLGDLAITDTDESEEDGLQQDESATGDEGQLDYLQLFAAAISTLRDEERGEEDDGTEEENEDERPTAKRRRLGLAMVVQPLEAVYAHFEQQDAHLQQAAAFGKMLLEKNRQLDEQLEVYQNSSILNEYQDKACFHIRMQQEKIWELQGQEENVRTELEELKVELKVKKRMLNSKSRLAEQLEAKLWDYIQKIEKEKENRDNEENKKMKKEMEQREKMRRLSDEVENYKEELKEAKSESERLRKQVTNLLDKLSGFRGDLTRERERKSRSNSFSRRITSFFGTKNENAGGDATGEIDDDDDGSDCESHGSDGDVGSAPGSRRQSARQQPVVSTILDNSEGAVVAELKEKTLRVKQENEGLRQELSALAEEHSRLRDTVTTMRDHERRLEKERKRERKLLAQAQQTIEELKLRIIDAQLLSTTASMPSAMSPSGSPSTSHKLPLSYSLPSTPYVGGSNHQQSASAIHASPLPGPSTPQTPGHHYPHHPLPLPQQTFSPRPYYQPQQPFSPRPQFQPQPFSPRTPYQQQPSSPPPLFAELQQQEEIERSVRDELAAIDDILLGDDDDLGIGPDTSTAASPRTSTASSTAMSAPAPPSDVANTTTPAAGDAAVLSLRAGLTPRSASMPVLTSSSSGGSTGDDKDKRVWVVAEGQRGRSSDIGEGSKAKPNIDEDRVDEGDRNDSGVDDAVTAKRASDGRLFIFAEELEKKVVQKFVYDEEELKAGLQEEVEACVADFLAKREQELQAVQPAVLRERRGRALSCERDDLLLFFGVFLTSAAAAKSDDAAMLLSSDPGTVIDAGEPIAGRDGDGDDSDKDGEEEEEDGWCILDEWRTSRQKQTSANGNAGKVIEASPTTTTAATTVASVSTTSNSGTRSRLGSISGTSGGAEGKSVAAVQTWVKHIPFDFSATKRQSSREENSTGAAVLSSILASPSSPSSPPTPALSSTSAPSASLSTTSTSPSSEDDELAKIEAAISGTPITATATTTSVSAEAAMSAPKAIDHAIDDDHLALADEERARIRAEMARLNGQLIARRKEVGDALRPIVAIVPATDATTRARGMLALPFPQRRPFHFLDLVLYD